MIILAMAIYCEAKPLIEKYRLNKDESYMPFTVFANEEKEILLIITGTGNAAAASSVAGVCAKLDLKADKNFLVNIGTCASASASDEIYICSKITDESSERTFYPDMIYKNPFKEAEIITSAVLFENKNDKNPQNTSDTVLYDMEAAFVWQAGAYFFAPHEMSFVKILSDNGDTEGITPDYITALVENHINIIDEYINRLRDILDDISCAGDEKAAKEKQLADKLCRDLCCSKTMEYELRQYIRYCFIENIDINGVVCKMYEENMMPCNDKREGKKRFEQLKSRLL